MLLKSLKCDLFKAAETPFLDPLMDIYGTSHQVKNERHRYSQMFLNADVVNTVLF